jgi:phospholipid-translocating ATPase
VWSERYHAATVTMEDREAQIEAISDELEQDLRLLGATAIEDQLQDGVPETIADLKRAGIKIWVATGDKLETAIGGYTSFYLAFLPWLTNNALFNL